MKLELTTEEINQILSILGQAPFAQVFQLIGNIQVQAQAQTNKQTNKQTQPSE